MASHLQVAPGCACGLGAFGQNAGAARPRSEGPSVPGAGAGCPPGRARSPVVTRIDDDENTWLFGHRWGVDSAAPAATPIASLIKEPTGAADAVTLLRLSSAGAGIIETAITAESKAAGRLLGDIALPEATLVATGEHENHAAFP
ncbi:hypothetical protein ACFZDI_08290 [Streptomyces sp. NPDC007907]|uniref:hypothetical protein n=1 Tax=Streptomyces sp. NPDC007907 TaxID=3364789 RepID=UPI0036E0201C